MNRIIINILLFAFFPLLGYAQHEFSIHGGGGMSFLKYEPSIGQQNNGFGGQYGLGYHYFFSPKLGIGTGLEFATYKAKFNANNINSIHNTIDVDGSPFEFRSSLRGYEENQTATILQIPVMMQYQFGSEQQFSSPAVLKPDYQ